MSARGAVTEERQSMMVIESGPAPVASPPPDVMVIAAGGQGPPGRPGSAGEGFEHIQASPSVEWIVNHNLGVKPCVQLFELGGAKFEADVIHISNNQFRVYLVAPIAGYARCV